MQRLMLRIVFTLAMIGLAAPALAQQHPTTSGGSGQSLLNVDLNSVALHGYDPVSYFDRERPRRGNKGIIERLGGAMYYFTSRASRYTFLKNAPAYQPQFGGYCAASMARGRLEDINPESFVVFDGKLYVFKDDAARAMFLKDPRGMMAEASRNYFDIASRQRRNY
jgi:hypothetical protein